MSDRLEQQLNELKNKPQAGAVDSAWLAKNKALLMMQVKNTMPAPIADREAQFAHTVESYRKRWFAPRQSWAMAMRPVFIFALAIIVPFGSWISTVSAARLSVQGDALYGVKIISEKVQLSLTSNKSTKIALHTEFAARRADEVVKLKAQEDVKHDNETKQNIKKTIERLETEIETANVELGALAEAEEPMVVREAARTLDVKSEEIGRVLEKTIDLSVEIPEISEAKELVDGVAVSAVETIVNTREQGEEEENETVDNEIKNTLEDKLKEATSEIDEVLLILDAAANTNTPKIIIEVKNIKDAQDQAEEALAVVKEASESVDSEAFEEAIEKVKEVKRVVNNAQKVAAKIQKESLSAVEEAETEEVVETTTNEGETTESIEEKNTNEETEEQEAQADELQQSEGTVEVDVMDTQESFEPTPTEETVEESAEEVVE